MKLFVAVALLLGAGLVAGQVLAQREGEEDEQQNREIEVTLPAQPRPDALIEFFVSGDASFRFYVDGASLAPGSDGVVRYTLVARSPSGVNNVSYEGIRCTDASYRVYAWANDGRWTVAKSGWRDIEHKTIKRWHNELYERYFCANGIIIQSAEEGRDALRMGARADFKPTQRAY